MKILLIVPEKVTYYGLPRYPLTGISMIGAVLLAEGFNVRAVDMRLKKTGDAELQKIIMSEQIDLVGFSVTNWDVLEATRIAGLVKSVSSSIKVVFGGPQATLCKFETIAYSEVDFVVYGEGERTILELVNALNTNNSDFSQIKGLCYKNIYGESVINRPRPLITDLDALPYPAYELFGYDNYSAVGQRRLGISATRGCPYGCIFCTGKTVMGQLTRCRRPESVVLEMKHWIDKFKITHFCFNEDNIFGQPGYGETLLDELIKAKINVSYSLEVGVRSDALSEEICNKLVETGCTIVAIGIESVDPDVLKNIKKGETIDVITMGIRNAKKAGLFIKGYFIVGLPGDSHDKIKKAVEYAIRENIDMPRFALAQAFPNTELEKWVEQHGNFYFQPIEYTLKHTDEFHTEVHYEVPGFSREQIWNSYIWAKNEAEKISFRQAVLRKYGLKTGSILNLLNLSYIRKFIIFLYQHKYISLPR